MSTFAVDLAKRGSIIGNTLELQGVGFVASHPEITVTSGSSTVFAVVKPEGVRVKQTINRTWQRGSLKKVARNADIHKEKVLKPINNKKGTLETDIRSIAIYSFIDQFFENYIHVLKAQRAIYEDKITIYTNRMLPIEITLAEHADGMVIATVIAQNYGVYYTTPITDGALFADSFMSLY